MNVNYEYKSEVLQRMDGIRGIGSMGGICGMGGVRSALLETGLVWFGLI